MKRIAIFCLFLLSAISISAKVTLTALTVEGRTAPTGLDVLQPRLGWQIVSDQQDVVQTSYHIQLSKSVKGKANVWDSGIVSCNQSQWVAINAPLQPNTEYFWRVKVTTNKGDSEWSSWSKWSTGLLDESNWKGDWIGYDSLTQDVIMDRHSRIAARHLRKAFTVKKRIKRATVHVCGLGYYILNINGQRIGDYLLAPTPTQYDKAVCYDTYDVTKEIVNCKSSNCKLEAVLAGGYFFPMTQNYQTNVRTAFGMPKMRLNLIVEYRDGSSETIATDSSWQVAVDGPVRYANLYDGTLIDYRMQPTAWKPVQIVDAPCQVMRGGLLGGVKAYRTETAKNITKTGNKRFIVDYGTNNTGRIYLPSVTIAHGDTVTIRYAETLKDNGRELYTANMRQAQNTDYFVGNGSPVTMTTEFLWHGFRYMEVSGLDETAVRNIQRQLMTDDLLSTATIDIDEGDGVINRILDNARRGILSNYKGIPMDCPQRDERMPWLGDRTAGCFGESYMTRNHALYSKWLTDICDAQRKDGNISDVCPAYWRLYNGNITWPAALPFGMEMLRLQYGDERPMQKMADNVKRFLAFAKKKSGKDGLITYDRYGDWCVPPATLDEVLTKDSTRLTDGALLSSCYYYYICKQLGMDDEAAATRDAINRHFLKDGCYANGTVTANLLPLTMGIVPDEARNSVLANFVRRVKGTSGQPHIDCGVIGISWLMRYLSKAGLGDIAYQIASAKTYPGWGYMAENGATTIWELWNGNTANPSMNSGNHVMMLGDLIPWAYECLAGIAPDSERPGFKHIIMRPDFSIDSIRGAKASYPSLYGDITSHWQRNGRQIIWNITIPANTTATIHLANGTTKDIGSGTHHVEMDVPVERPTMGWSSWNTYRVNINDSLIMRQADAMVAKGLKDAGYTYINIDDGYFGGRDQQSGRLKIHPTRFPNGLKPVVDHIHSLGLKAGIYSDAGANTCGNWYDKDTIAVGVGLYDHDQQDCNLFFRDLGFDFIKIDFCGAIANRNSDHLGLSPQERYTAIRRAIDNTGRKDVRMNVCRWDYPGTWVSEVASSWRMSRDISPKWSVVKEIILQNLYLSAYAGGGRYNDMDMLEVGRKLTYEEDRTHFGIWCMMSSPLLIGCDMATLKPQTLELLTNRELIAIDQDPLGLQAHVVKYDKENGTYVLVKDLLERGGLTRAVAFYNPTDEPQTMQVGLADLELAGTIQVKDLYEGGSQFSTLNSSFFTQTVPAHGCRIFRMTATERLPRTRYEAETAYLTSYQELSNPHAIGSAYYAEDTQCSGGMKVVNLGGHADNDLQWRDVFCQENGTYTITIHCASFSNKAALIVAANGGAGQVFKTDNAKDGDIHLTLSLKKGLNTIRLYCDYATMPDIDYMTINMQ